MSYDISLELLQYTKRTLSRTSVGLCIIIFKEKHGDRYFVSRNEEEFAAVFLQILEERVSAGYWYNLSDTVGEVQAKLGVFRTDKIGGVRYGFGTDVTKMRAETESMQALLDTKEHEPLRAGQLAFQFLSGLTDHEYEGFEIERAETIE